VNKDANGVAGSSADIERGIENARKAIERLSEMKVIQDAKEAVGQAKAIIESVKEDNAYNLKKMEAILVNLDQKNEALIHQLGEKEKELARLRPGRSAARTRR